MCCINEARGREDHRDCENGLWNNDGFEVAFGKQVQGPEIVPYTPVIILVI